MLNLLEQLQPFTQQLISLYHKQEAQQVVWWLLEKATGKKEAELLANPKHLDHRTYNQIQEWIHQHVNEHKPLQYILGTVPFGTLEILVQPPTLIPRPETEEWCLRLCDQLKTVPTKKLNILDLCTGSGCIAVALAHAMPSSTIIATDISTQALLLARKNAEHNKCHNVTIMQSDLFAQVPGTFDLIVGNPPYLAHEEWDNLDPMVKNWEDVHALVADNQGLALIEKIIQQAPAFLQHNQEMKDKNIPQLILEIGFEQGEAVADIFKKNKFHDVQIVKDLEGKDRIVQGRIT